MKFKKGHKKLGGRKKGSSNKFTDIKQDIFDVWSDIDGYDKLVEYATASKQNFFKFVQLMASLLPKEIRQDIEFNLKTLINDVHRAETRSHQYMEN